MTETGAGSNLVPRAFPFKLGREDTPRNSWKVCAARFSDLDPPAISGQNMLELMVRPEIWNTATPFFRPGLEKLFSGKHSTSSKSGVF